VRKRIVRTPSVIAGDAYLSRGLRKCQDLLRQIMRHEHAWPFAKPVDPVALNIPDYFDIIKYPMDFGTIKVDRPHHSIT
jgi:NAD(P)H-dependent FMN reductase